MRLTKNIVLSTVLATFLFSGVVTANNGKNLFKQNCSACHKVDKKAIGPALKGVKAKWVEAGEEANLVSWVQNSAKLYESGSSEMAKAIWDFSPSAMTPMEHLSAEDINGIFDYVENYVPEEKVEIEESANPNRKAGEPLTDEVYYSAEEIKANQKEKNKFNIILFSFLILLAGCIVAGIVSVSKTIQSFLTLIIKRGDKPNKTSKKENNIVKAILAIVALSPLAASAASLQAESESSFVVSDIHNLILFACNLVLLWVLFEHKKTLKSVIEQYDPSLLKKRNKAGEEVKEESLTKILTGAVPVEEEASILMDHEYDGIRELDNNLPPWWLWGFYISIVFAFVYLIHYHVAGTGDLQIAEYEKSVAEAQVEVDKYMSKMAMNVDENNVTILTESADIEKGSSLFSINCVVCHKEKGEGLIGPNLTDKYWITGTGSINDVFKIIKYGSSNGMPEHESKMNPKEIQQVASYVLQLDYTEGKAPEGEEVK